MNCVDMDGQKDGFDLGLVKVRVVFHCVALFTRQQLLNQPSLQPVWRPLALRAILALNTAQRRLSISVVNIHMLSDECTVIVALFGPFSERFSDRSSEHDEQIGR